MLPYMYRLFLSYEAPCTPPVMLHGVITKTATKWALTSQDCRHCVIWYKCTDISEDCSVCIIGLYLLVKEAAEFFEMSIHLYKTT